MELERVIAILQEEFDSSCNLCLFNCIDRKCEVAEAYKTAIEHLTKEVENKELKEEN